VAVIASDSEAIQTKRPPQTPSLDCFALLAMTAETIRLKHNMRLNQSSKWLSTPSASLGSNQVDFGGMIAPASATAIRSVICVG